jgi:cold shock protein
LFLFFVKIQIESEENVNNMKGTIKWYNARKGYGFIQSEDGKEIFVHRTAVPMETSLNEGDAVEFEIETSDRGPQAKNVKKA